MRKLPRVTKEQQAGNVFADYVRRVCALYQLPASVEKRLKALAKPVGG